MSAPALKKSEGETSRALHSLAVEIIIRLHAVLKSARIYEPHNTLFQRQVSLLLSLIRKAMAEFGEAAFSIRQSTLFFNNIRLRYGFANYHFFKFVIEEFRKRGVGSLRFEPGLNAADLTSFIHLLARGEEKRAEPSQAIASEMKKMGVRTITMEKTLPADLAPRREKAAAKAFFLGITHLEEAFASAASEEKIKLSTTRRLMQAIFNHIVDNEAFVQGLTNIKNFHEYTLNHSMNVCILAIALGKRLGLDRNELVDLGISAFFHDFGKLDTPREILEKPARLDDQERKIIEKHPYQGAAKLVQFKGFKNLPVHAVHVAMEHHIKEDWGGYPRFFRKQTISLFSKIVKIVDFFDAITTKRPYRSRVYTRDEALSLMLEQSGKEFHPVLLREFVRMMGIYPVGTLVMLDTGELGIVVQNHSETELLLRPLVKLITDADRNKLDGDIVDLSELDPETNKYKKTIIKTLDPEKYHIRVTDYLLAQAE